MVMPNLTGMLDTGPHGNFVWYIGSSSQEFAADKSPKPTDKYKIPDVGHWFAWKNNTYKVESLDISDYTNLMAYTGIPVEIVASKVCEGIYEDTY